MAQGIMVSVPFDDLPDSAEVTGRAVRKNPPAFKDEEQPDTVVLAFRRKSIADVRAELEGKDYSTIEITDIRFS